MHGHQHKPKVTVYQSLGLNGAPMMPPIHVVASGSTGAKKARLPGSERNTYCLFRLNENGINLWIRELRMDGHAGAEIFEGTLAVQPIK